MMEEIFAIIMLGIMGSILPLGIIIVLSWFKSKYLKYIVPIITAMVALSAIGSIPTAAEREACAEAVGSFCGMSIGLNEAWVYMTIGAFVVSLIACLALDGEKAKKAKVSEKTVEEQQPLKEEVKVEITLQEQPLPSSVKAINTKTCSNCQKTSDSSAKFCIHCFKDFPKASEE